VISLTDFFDAASQHHSDVILLPAICRVSDNNFVFQQDSAPAHEAVHAQQLNCCINKHQTFLHSTCGLQTAEICPVDIGVNFLQIVGGLMALSFPSPPLPFPPLSSPPLPPLPFPLLPSPPLSSPPFPFPLLRSSPPPKSS